MNLKNDTFVKYTTFCRGINGGGTGLSKKIIQYIVDYIYIYIYIRSILWRESYECPIYRMHGA